MAPTKDDIDDFGDLAIEKEIIEDTEGIELSSSEDIKSIKPYDNTVELVGYIDSIEAPRLVGTKNNKIFKFFLNNGDGERIQVTCWNAESDRIEPLLRTNFIVHVDGAYAKPSIINNFNKGTVNFELIIQSNTIVNILGKHLVQESEVESKLVILADALNYKNLIRTQGYIKSNFYLIKNQTSKASDYGCGSITDGDVKLEVRIPDMDVDNTLNKGDHVEVTGYIQFNANPVYLLVTNLSSVRLVDNQRMPLGKLLKGNKPLAPSHLNAHVDQTPAKKQRLQ